MAYLCVQNRVVMSFLHTTKDIAAVLANMEEEANERKLSCPRYKEPVPSPELPSDELPPAMAVFFVILFVLVIVLAIVSL